MSVREVATFRCGACGTTVTDIPMFTGLLLEKVMRIHAEVCPGHPPASSPGQETRL